MYAKAVFTDLFCKDSFGSHFQLHLQLWGGSKKAVGACPCVALSIMQSQAAE